jgi:hypothetical protein
MELTSVSCQAGYYRKMANLRVRPVHEMEVCLVFTPDSPNLYSLNPTAWLILELCDGRRVEELENAYYAIVEPLLSREGVSREVRGGIEELKRKGIIEWVADDRFEGSFGSASEGKS